MIEPSAGGPADVHVPQHTLAAFNEISRHTGCPSVCALGAVLAVLWHRLTRDTWTGPSSPHQASCFPESMTGQSLDIDKLGKGSSSHVGDL